MKRFVAFLLVAPAVLIVGSLTLATALAQSAPPTVVEPENDRGNYAPGNTLILYGDMVVGSGSTGLVTCALNNRYKPGQSVVFRMTALKPMQGEFDETATLTVTIKDAQGQVLTDPALVMKYRGADANPQPGFWTVRWVVPQGTLPQVLEYSVHAKDAQGRTGNWEPYNKANSKLTITS